VVALDEERLPRSCPTLGEPHRKVASAIVLLGRLVDSVRIGPDAEVPDVKHPLETHAERGLERENVFIKAIYGAHRRTVNNTTRTLVP
jgi:hypothetical protein